MTHIGLTASLLIYAYQFSEDFLIAVSPFVQLLTK